MGLKGKFVLIASFSFDSNIGSNRAPTLKNPSLLLSIQVGTFTCYEKINNEQKIS